MVPDRIEREIVIDAPVEVVWGIVTEPEQISCWFSDSAHIDPRPGADGTLSWNEYGTVLLRVEKVEPPHLFSFRWLWPVDAEPDETNSPLVEFSLSEETGRTRLRVVESGVHLLDRDDEGKAAYVEDHERGWDRHLADLLAYVGEKSRAATR